MRTRNLLSVIMLAAAMLWPAMNGCANNTPADNDPAAKLPAAAQALIKQHFAGKQLLLVKQDTEWTRRYYDVMFSDGTKLEFDSKGQWVELDCKPAGVPEALIPQQILSFVKKTYPSVIVTQIERDRRGYDVDLSNGLDLEFNRNFQLINIDD